MSAAYSHPGCPYCGVHESRTWSHCLGCGQSFCDDWKCAANHRQTCAPFFGTSTNIHFEFFFGSSHFSGYGATTRPPQSTSTIPREVVDALTLLGLSGTPNAEQIRQAYRKKAKEIHPDKGGSHEQMVKLNTAKEKALAWIGGK